MNQGQVDSIIRHQAYLSMFGSGLANRILNLFDNEKLSNLIESKKNRKEEISSLLEKDRKKADKLIERELRKMAKLEIRFIEQISSSFVDLNFTKGEILERMLSALNKPLVVSNNTPQDLYNSAYRRKEEIATSLNSIYNLDLKEDVTDDIKAMFAQFANGMIATNLTYTFAICSQIRESAYSQFESVDREMMCAVLDGRTTPFCMRIDSRIFPKGKGARPPFHARCRTVSIPLLDDQTDEEALDMLQWRSSTGAGKDYQKGDAKSLRSTRAQRDRGKVDVKNNRTQNPSSGSYADFLAVQRHTSHGRQFIIDVLGIKKGNVFIELSGKVDNKKLLNALIPSDVGTLTIKGLKKSLRM